MTGSAAYAGRGAGAGTRPVRYLRDLYFFRCGFSDLWVALEFTLASAGTGAGSVFAGISFTGWTGSPSAGLTALAQYSAGGAVWSC